MTSSSSILNLITWIDDPTTASSNNNNNKIETTQRAAQTLATICRNILQNPTSEKFRRVRIFASSSSQNNNDEHHQSYYSPPIQQIINVSKTDKKDAIFDWFQHVGFISSETSKDFLEFSTAAPMGRLDEACVAAMNFSEKCKEVLQKIQDRKIEDAITNQKMDQTQQQNRQMSSLEEYRRFANDRKMIEEGMEKYLLVKLDEFCEKSSSSNNDDHGVNNNNEDVKIQNWNRQQSALVSVLEFFLKENNNNSINNAESVVVSFPEEARNPTVKAVLNFICQELLSPSPNDESLRHPGMKLLSSSFKSIFQLQDDTNGKLTKFIVNSSSCNTANQQQSHLLQIHLQAALDLLEKFRQEQAQKFDSLRNEFRHKIQNKDHEQQIKLQKEINAVERPIHIHPELEHTALSLINDISGFMELCWHLEGARGYVANHKIEAKRLLEEFLQGRMQVQDLRKLKEEWERKYEKMKLERGMAFFGGQNPVA